MAWAGVPDLATSTADTDAGAQASVFNLPNGAGAAMTEAFLSGGTAADATITLTLIDTAGDPIFLYPFEDLWLQTTGGGLIACEGGTFADQATDANGQTTWSGTLRAGGSSPGELTQVYVAGAPLAGAGLDIIYNSADFDGDLLVNLTDIGLFTQTLGVYDYAGDFNYDGVINLTDIAFFTPGIGTQCE
jgi:hypothetical protein